jgi:predicted DNA binding CopG/RHH family protein
MDDSRGQDSCRHRVFGWRFGQKGLSGDIPMKKEDKRIVPKFATEAEEAEWWYRNREVHGKELLEAGRSGEALKLTREKLLDRVAESKRKPARVVALRIPAADLAIARKQAELKGVPYQTYVKSLLHETLTKREERKIG